MRLIATMTVVLIAGAATAEVPDGIYKGQGDGGKLVIEVRGETAHVSLAGDGCSGGGPGIIMQSTKIPVIRLMDHSQECHVEMHKAKDGTYDVVQGPDCAEYHGASCAMSGTVTRVSDVSRKSSGKGNVDCSLTVDGKVIFKERCEFSPGDGGSFQISQDPLGYFADVQIISKGVAQGYWNGGDGYIHAHADLGTLERNGACWSNAKNSVCAEKSCKRAADNIERQS